MAKIEIPEFQTKKEQLKFLSQNQSKLIAQKKATMKFADGFAFVGIPNMHSYGVMKAVGEGAEDATQIRVKSIINTTNLMDSHDDVHLPSIWDKSLQENKMIMHLQEHEINKFSSIIADGSDLEASVKQFTFTELGFEQYGNMKTQALFFDSLIKRERNPYMFQQYLKGYVKNHSVGMRYVKIFLAIADKEIASAQEHENWLKYIDQIANREHAEDKEFFWGVSEAKAIEGSAVPLGSNFVTPTISAEAVKALPTEAEKSLQDKKNYFLNL